MLQNPSAVVRLTVRRLAAFVSLAAVPMALALAINPDETNASHAPADDLNAEAAAQPVNSNGAEVPVARKSPDVLTPEQAVQQQPKGKVTVEFRVASVGLYGWTDQQLSDFLQGTMLGFSHGSDPPIRLESSARLPNGGKFYVLLCSHAMPQAAKDVQHLAAKDDHESLCVYRLIKPLQKHFTGKTIRATGELENTKVPRRVREDGTVEGPLSDEYVLRVGSPDGFRVLPNSGEGVDSAKGADTPSSVTRGNAVRRHTERVSTEANQAVLSRGQGDAPGNPGGSPCNYSRTARSKRSRPPRISAISLTAPGRAALEQYWAALDQIRAASGQATRRKR